MNWKLIQQSSLTSGTKVIIKVIVGQTLRRSVYDWKTGSKGLNPEGNGPKNRSYFTYFHFTSKFIFDLNRLISKGMSDINSNSSYWEKFTFSRFWFSKLEKFISRPVFGELQLIQISNFKTSCWNSKNWGLEAKVFKKLKEIRTFQSQKSPCLFCGTIKETLCLGIY